MFLRTLPLLTSLLLLGACAADDRSLGRGPLGKADSVGSCQASDGSSFCGGPSDGTCWCDEDCVAYGDCCDDLDAVCGDGYDACDGLSCGASCDPCPPDDLDCVAPSVPFVCQADGSCGFTIPECEPVFDSCEDKLCGDVCTLCEPGDPDCVETEVIKVCQADGSCSSDEPVCDPGDEYDPCEGLTCGASCTLCDPANPNCVETSVLKFCQESGVCAATTPSC